MTTKKKDVEAKRFLSSRMTFSQSVADGVCRRVKLTLLPYKGLTIDIYRSRSQSQWKLLEWHYCYLPYVTTSLTSLSLSIIAHSDQRIMDA